MLLDTLKCYVCLNNYHGLWRTNSKSCLQTCLFASCYFAINNFAELHIASLLSSYVAAFKRDVC